MRGDQGSATAEYVALLVVVAVLVLAVPAATIGGHVVALIQAGLCELTPRLCGDPTGGRSDEDFVPARCTVSGRSYRGDLGLSVALFDARGGLSFARSDRSDATTAFTLVDRGSLGLGAELGARAKVGSLGVEAGTEAGAALLGRAGDTWIVPSAQADELQRRLATGEMASRGAGHVANAAGMTAGGPWLGELLRHYASAGVDRVADHFLGELPPPDITYRAGGIEGEAGVKLWTPWLVEARTGMAAGVQVGRAVVAVDATTTDYLEVEGSVTGRIGLGTELVDVDAGGEQALSGTVKVTRDAAGQLLQLEAITTLSGRAVAGLAGLADRLPTTTGAGIGSVVHTATLPLATAADRAIAERWLGSFGREGSAELADLVQRESRVSVVSYRGSERGIGVGAKAAVGAKLGAEVDVGQTTTDVVEAYYLGAPQASGQRDYVPFTACITASEGSST